MSASIASAKNKRAGIKPSTPPVSNTPTNTAQNVNSTGLTLPQVVALIDRRLINLETFMKETKEMDQNFTVPSESTTSNSESDSIVMDASEFNTFVDEINQRFQLLAEEVNGVKDALLKLQGYTMDVNKLLLGEFSKNNNLTLPNIPVISNDVDQKFHIESISEENITQ